MSASIEYSVVGIASNLTANELNSNVASDTKNYEWYIEPLFLFESNGLITGASKLFRLFDEQGEELDPADESPKVMKDIDQLVNSLTTLSSENSLTWELAIEGAPIGNISADGPDESLVKTLTEMLSVFGGNGLLSEEAASQEPKKKSWWEFW